jgi:hypothetical protein
MFPSSFARTAVELPPYCASPHVSTRPVLVSAANANPFLGRNVGELRMDSRCWRFTVGCVEVTLLGWEDGWPDGCPVG